MVIAAVIATAAITTAGIERDRCRSPAGYVTPRYVLHRYHPGLAPADSPCGVRVVCPAYLKRPLAECGRAEPDRPIPEIDSATQAPATNESVDVFHRGMSWLDQVARPHGERSGHLII